MAMMLDPSTTAGEPDRNPPADRAPVDEHPGLPMPRRWWAIVAAGFGTSLLVIDGAIANVALPTIARDLASAAWFRPPKISALPTASSPAW